MLKGIKTPNSIFLLIIEKKKTNKPKLSIPAYC